MAIDLGTSPVSPNAAPTEEERAQIRSSIQTTNASWIVGSNNDNNQGSHSIIAGLYNNDNQGATSLIAGIYNNYNFSDGSAVLGAYNAGCCGLNSLVCGSNFSYQAKIVTSGCSASSATNTLTKISHGLSERDFIQFQDADDTELSESVVYEVKYIDADNFKLYRLGGNTEVTIEADSSTSLTYVAQSPNFGRSCIIGGESNHSNSGFACIIGGSNASKNTLSYSFIMGGGQLARFGDSSISTQTTNNTPKNMLIGGGSFESDINLLRIPSDSAWIFTVNIVCSDSTRANAKCFTRRGLIRNDAGSTSISTLDTIGTDHVIGTLGTSISITADDTKDALIITVTGLAATTIDWSGKVEFVQVG
jgi:hypothetical protein